MTLKQILVSCFRVFDPAAAPSTRWASVTPSDTVNFTEPPRGIYIGGAGNISLVGQDNVAVTFAVSAGMLLPFCPNRVNSTGTTATLIKALY